MNPHIASLFCSLSACDLSFTLTSNPFSLHPSWDYPEAKVRRTSYQLENSLSRILTSGKPQMGYRSTEISSPGSTGWGLSTHPVTQERILNIALSHS